MRQRLGRDEQRECDAEPEPRAEAREDPEGAPVLEREREQAADENRAVRRERPAATRQRQRELRGQREQERKADSPARALAQQDEGDERPEEIELLLDPER